jgi:hypothetical protein
MSGMREILRPRLKSEPFTVRRIGDMGRSRQARRAMWNAAFCKTGNAGHVQAQASWTSVGFSKTASSVVFEALMQFYTVRSP